MVLAEQADAPDIVIDIEKQELRCEGLPNVQFEISPRYQEMFLKGVDVVGMSLTYMDEVHAFAQAHWAQQPWIKDVAARMTAAARA
jgi:3-isopropylmalate/(R)-2-methylmalate dehydratase small subunit